MQGMSQPRSLFSVLREAINARDPITGTLHPVAFEKAVQGWIGGGASARRPSSSLLLIGIDWTTRAGRTARPGKRQGDAVLKTVAEISSTCLRVTDVIGRVDDEILGILLPSTPAQQAEHVCRRVRAAVSERTPATGYPVTVSIGLATGLLTDPWTGAQAALEEAQLAGGHRIVISGTGHP